MVDIHATTQRKMRKSKMGKSLRERKEELIKGWEECFGVELKTQVNERGFEFIWDDSTSALEVRGFLTFVAVNMCVDDIFGAVISIKNKKEDSDVKPFKVMRTKDNFIYREEFETEEAAKEHIKGIAMSTSYTVEDFKVIQVHD